MTATLNELEAQAKAISDLVTADRVVISERYAIDNLAVVQQVPTAYFLADRAYEVESISEVHDTAQGSADGASLMVTKNTGTQAPGASETHLITDTAFSGTDNVYKGFNLKATAHTVQNATMTNQVASRLLAAGDRLVFGFNGTLSTTYLAVTTVLKKV